MVQAAYSSISGIVAAFQLQSVSAHNVANSNTDNYKSTIARAEEAYKGGVKVSLSKSRYSSASYDAGSGQKQKPSDVSYAKEATNQIGSKHLLAANLAVLKTYDEMTGTLIDTFA